MDTLERDVIAEALAVIDKSLGQLTHRELVSTSEMTDLLLDMRSLLSEPHPETLADTPLAQ